ncbi:hypothetical protein HII31_00126 [Pseudocercospora fuligena]|uniref:Uncharacterized protein n=1 Tax=Pseudocercospora fuligena TaxID=685502 RepID=A0A8H6VQ24_9PEZI|nr:hypothetical protein HII31_00126 [Pseudocercospora fuligena]
MPPPLGLILPNIDFIHQETFSSGFNKFVADRSIVWNLIVENWSSFLAWLTLPHVYSVIIAWAITFTVVAFLLLSLGFGPGGIIAGSAAAAFQSWAYGGFTPAGGIFATLTSLAMLGYLVPPVALCASVLATIVAVTVWACSVGR